MIYISGSNGLIGKKLSKSIVDYIPISYRNEIPEISFLPKSILIHLSSSITPRNSFDDLEKSFQNDVLIPFKIFQEYLKTNPNGKIIFLSSAGDLHSCEFNILMNENSIPKPKSIYGTHKLLLENYIQLLHKTNKFSSIILRVTNVYGEEISLNRVNGLIDKLILSAKTKNKIIITANVKGTVNFIHVDDLIELILKAIQANLNEYNLFLVGCSRSITIEELLKKVCFYISPNILFENEYSNPSYINIDTTKVQKYFNWNCKYSIDDGIIKQIQTLNVL